MPKKKIVVPTLLSIDENGIIEPPEKFEIEGIVYSRVKQQIIIHLCPYVPYDIIDERSVYSTLLMHLPWTINGEINLLLRHVKAVDALKSKTDRIATICKENNKRRRKIKRHSETINTTNTKLYRTQVIRIRRQKENKYADRGA